jgi:hypothetical protein
MIIMLLCNVWGSLNYLIILRGLQEIQDLFVRVCSLIKLKKKIYGKKSNWFSEIFQVCFQFFWRRNNAKSKVTNQGGNF